MLCNKPKLKGLVFYLYSFKKREKYKTYILLRRAENKQRTKRNKHKRLLITRLVILDHMNHQAVITLYTVQLH